VDGVKLWVEGVVWLEMDIPRGNLGDDKCGLHWDPWIVGLDGRIWPKWWAQGAL